jgi:hypothetical protein
MTGKLTELPQEWDFPGEDSPLPEESITLLNYLSRKVFNDYEPTQFHPFRARLLDWINNLSDPLDQQMLLSLLLDVFYVGRREFEALFRSAYRGPISRWILDASDLDVFSPNLAASIQVFADDLWICPVSDSLRINSFLKVNGLKSKDVRSDWRSLRRLGDAEKIRGYVSSKEIKGLVLLEDFVGSGRQATAAVKFAATSLPDLPILFCPLVVCPKGDRALIELTNGLKNVQYDPVVVLPDDVVLNFEKSLGTGATRVDHFLKRIMPSLQTTSVEFMYGFEETDAKVVLFSNCPNNTLPIFHHESDQWNPLFPRVTRQS